MIEFSIWYIYDIQITILYAIYNTIITYKIQNINFSHEIILNVHTICTIIKLNLKEK